MPATYEPIATTTLGSAAATITFSSIPATYTDLRVALVGNSITSASPTLMRFNNDSGTNYSWTRLLGDGSTTFSSALTSQTSGQLSTTYTGSNPSATFVDVFSYAGSTNKTFLANGNYDQNGSGGVGRYVNLWRNTAAINRIDLLLSGASFATGTTATIYGILKA